MTTGNALRRATLLPALFAVLTVLTAAHLTAGVAHAQAQPMVTVTDPVERAFKLQMPRGWRNQAYLVRAYEMYRTVVTSLSPDGKTLLFAGDPHIPGYFVPTEYFNESNIATPLNPLMKFGEFEAADAYFTRYVRDKFGKLPGFRLTGARPNPALLQVLERGAKRNKMNTRNSVVLITFDYTDNGKQMHALINGATMSAGTIWIADLSGVTTTGDPTRHNALLMQMSESFRTDPGWKAKQQALHEARMAQLRQDHQNMIASFSVSNQNHQLRMKAIQDSGSASMKRWYENQAAGDATHRKFINYITGENTVVDGSGTAYQVDNSHQRYYVHKRNNTYIGTDSHTNLEDLRQKMRLNPDDYKEVKIKH